MVSNHYLLDSDWSRSAKRKGDGDRVEFVIIYYSIFSGHFIMVFYSI